MTLCAVVMLDAADGDDVASGNSRPLTLVEGGAPPSEYLMFGPGINETVKGPLLFDEDAAKAVLAFYESRGRKRLAGDWEHDSMVPPEQRAPGYKGSPASHWFDLEVRDGPELWATAIKWTPTAFAQISNGEYAHTSPVVKFQKDSGRIMAVLSSALTNDPATIGQPQLVAASAESTKPPTAATMEKPMGMWKMADDAAAKIKGIVDGTHEHEADMVGKMKACLAESFPMHFGEKKETADLDPAANAKLAEDMGKKAPAVLSAEDMEEKKEMKALRADLKALTGKDSRIEQVAALTAMRDASLEVATLTAKVRANDGSAFDAVIAKGRAAMKIAPADLADNSRTGLGKYIASQRSKGADGVLALTAYLDAAPARAVTAETAVRESENKTLADLATVELTDFDKANCAKYGHKPEEILKLKQAEAAERRAAGITTNR